MASVSLVQGASRGIGLQFCRNLLARSPEATVIATCRAPEKAAELRELQGKHPNNLHVLQVDVTQENHIQAAAQQVTQMFGRLDLLINSAGMLHPSGRGETSLRDVSSQGLLTTIQTNTIGPLLMAKYFAPLLAKGTGQFGSQAPEKKDQHSAVLVNMSAKVGSIADNALGGWYSYRLSKTALNMATKTLSIELGRGRNRVLCVSLHPGTVDTDLSRPYHKNVPKLLSVEESVSNLLKVIDTLTVQDTGKFFAYDRTLLPY